VEKPSTCVVCGAPLEQPATGRPRRYCCQTHRRAAEYALRRVQAQLAMAEKRELLARETIVTARAWGSATDSARKLAKFWAGEVERLENRLLELLSGAGEEVSPPQ
jgi:hypothetical protein